MINFHLAACPLRRPRGYWQQLLISSRWWWRRRRRTGEQASGGRARTTDGEHQQPGTSRFRSILICIIFAPSASGRWGEREFCAAASAESNLLLNVIADLGSGRVRQPRKKQGAKNHDVKGDIRWDLRFPVLLRWHSSIQRVLS